MERWASSVRCPEPGTSTVEGYLHEKLDNAYNGVDMSEEIEITERAVCRTYLEDKAYKRIIRRYWLGRLPTVVIAQDFDKPEASIKRLLNEANNRVRFHVMDIERKKDLTADKWVLQ